MWKLDAVCMDSEEKGEYAEIFFFIFFVISLISVYLKNISQSSNS